LLPEGNKLGANPYQVDVFRGYPALEVVNTPKEYLSQVPADQLPAFWLAAGGQDKSDVSTAESFRQLLLARLAKVPMLIVLGGGHQGSVWRTALGPMLSWMTPFLAERRRRRTRPGAQRAVPNLTLRAPLRRRESSPR
jgi:hypothetical protein